MEILRFSLSGKHAFFKKPEVNSYCYFTYGNIHKVALLGIFGSILGYGGYTQMQSFVKAKKQAELTSGYPEFYEKLRFLKVSILPALNCKNGIIPKKIQTFNNSVGYASREQGGNLIVKEQWLENPEWEICVLVDSEEAEKLKDAICHNKCIYYPYLGKNDHPADIRNIKMEKAVRAGSAAGRLNCLSPKEKVGIYVPDYEDLDDLEDYAGFKYEEALPCGMDEWTNHYIIKTYLYTDDFIETEADVYELEDGKRILFD